MAREGRPGQGSATRRDRAPPERLGRPNDRPVRKRVANRRYAEGDHHGRLSKKKATRLRVASHASEPESGATESVERTVTATQSQPVPEATGRPNYHEPVNTVAATRTAAVPMSDSDSLAHVRSKLIEEQSSEETKEAPKPRVLSTARVVGNTDVLNLVPPARDFGNVHLADLFPQPDPQDQVDHQPAPFTERPVHPGDGTESVCNVRPCTLKASLPLPATHPSTDPYSKLAGDILDGEKRASLSSRRTSAAGTNLEKRLEAFREARTQMEKQPMLGPEGPGGLPSLSVKAPAAKPPPMRHHAEQTSHLFELERATGGGLEDPQPEVDLSIDMMSPLATQRRRDSLSSMRNREKEVAESDRAWTKCGLAYIALLEKENKNLANQIQSLEAKVSLQEQQILKLRDECRSSQNLQAANTGDAQARKKRKVSSKASLDMSLSAFHEQLEKDLDCATGDDEEHRTYVTLKVVLATAFKTKLRASINREISEAGLDEQNMMNQKWYPLPVEVSPNHGQGTFIMNAISFIPENPMNVVTRGLLAGALSVVPEVVEEQLMLRCGQEPSENGKVGTKGLVRRLLETYAQESDSHALKASEHSESRESVRKAVIQDLVSTSVLESDLRNKVTRRASDTKRAFVRKMMTCLPNFRLTDRVLEVENEDDSSSDELESMRLARNAVALVFGGGNYSPGPDDVFKSWKESRAGQKELFGAWRKLDRDDMQEALEDAYSGGMSFFPSQTDADHDDDDADSLPTAPTLFSKSRCKDWCRVSPSQWHANTTPRGFRNEEGQVGGDLLFKNSHAAQAMALWMRRPLENGKMEGRTSIASIARADAWMAAHMSLSKVAVPPGGTKHSGGGQKNARHNYLFQILLPHAVSYLTEEMRSVLLKVEDEECRLTPEGGPLSELRKAFSPTRFDEIASEVGLQDSSSPSACVDWQKVYEELDKDPSSQVKSESHRLNPWSCDFRHHTVVYRSGDAERDYVVLLPEFFKKHICPWFGQVCDAYVGECERDEQYFSPLSLKYCEMDQNFQAELSS